MAFMVAVNNRENSVTPLPFTVKNKKGKSQIVTPTLPQSQGPEALGSLPQKRPTEGSEQSHSVSSGNVPNPQDLKRNIQLTGTGLPSTQLDEGTRKSDPKDLVGNKQPIDTGLPSMVSDEGTDAEY
ncbi:hypothetical protein Tco_0021478 [Tanacetum coccineum]